MSVDLTDKLMELGFSVGASLNIAGNPLGLSGSMDAKMLTKQYDITENIQ